MADKSVGELPRAPAVYADSLFVMEQQGTDYSATGDQLMVYARQSVADIAQDAQESADDAQASADRAARVALYPPKVQGGNWWIYDEAAAGYKDSGIDATVTVKIGTVTTVDQGSAAKVTNRGTDTDMILDFTVPLGGMRGSDTVTIDPDGTAHAYIADADIATEAEISSLLDEVFA